MNSSQDPLDRRNGLSATLADGSTVTVEQPKGTTHYVLNLIDENNFLASYPDMPGANEMSQTKEKFAPHAIASQVQEE